MYENPYIFDIEIYKNYSLFLFKRADGSDVQVFELRGEDSKLKVIEKRAIRDIIKNNVTAGYNSVSYDLTILILALRDSTAKDLYNYSVRMIEGGVKWYDILYKELKSRFSYKNIKHVDLFQVASNAKVSLKMLGARMHTETIQELPINPHNTLSSEDMDNIKKYCFNDIQITTDLYNMSLEKILLRSEISDGVNMLSYSDPKIAETILLHKLGIKSTYNPEEDKSGIILKPVLQLNKDDFKSKILKNLYSLIEFTEFKTIDKGKVELPDSLSNYKIEINGLSFAIGIGGLHSKEKKQVIIPNDNQILIDADVTSYYPNIMLINNLYPKELGKEFLNVYRDILEKRVQAKKEGNKTVDSTYKIVLNGTFGKLGSVYSNLYSPDMLLSICLNGQLNLLLLIEKLSDAGFKVVSANTDGVVTLLDKKDIDKYKKICNDWMSLTKYNLEYSEYSKLFSRDVNNYFAVTTNGYIKRKGAFSTGGFAKNPSGEITIDAAINYLNDGIPIEETINNCKDIRKFVHIRKVEGGANYNGVDVGSVVRWYNGKDGSVITYSKNGNKVANSDGACLLQKMYLDIDNIDYEAYYKDAIKVVESVGVKI